METGYYDKNKTPIRLGDTVCFDGGKTESRAKMNVVKRYDEEDEEDTYCLNAFGEDWCYELEDCLESTLEVVNLM